MDILDFNSMKGGIPDIEKTQAELRKTFNAAEEYRRELEYLQKGGNPLDLKSGNAASISEAKGSFAITASHHEDSVESSGRLGVQLVCESNTADNLVLFNGENKFPEIEKRSVTPLEHYSQLDSGQTGQNARKSSDSAALELPKKSYKRRVRSKPNRDGTRNGFSNFNSKITNLDSNNRLDTNGPSPAISDTNGSQNSRKNQHDSTKGLESESSWTQKTQILDADNDNELPIKMEQNLESNEVSENEGNNSVKENECKKLNNLNGDFNSCNRAHNEDDEDLKRSILESKLSVTGPTDISEKPDCSENNLNLVNKEHEDFILKEAHIIEAKHKIISELSVSTLQLHNHQKSHWDLVLEEMSWLANDFAQERVWKLSAAAQISRKVAFASQIKYQQQISSLKQKEVAQTLGKFVMEFWHKTEVKCITDSTKGLQNYAKRFLEYNNTHAQCSTAQVFSTADIISDVSIISIACDDNLTEENLVYTVPPGAIEKYRKSIESHLLQCERGWSGVQEEMDTSGYDAIGETRAYYSPQAFEDTKNRRKNIKFYNSKSYETGDDFLFKQSFEKDTENTLNVSLPIKHVRTASRQRVIGPFNGPNKIEAFSGDTESFQYEQNVGPQMGNNMEAESAVDYEKQLQFDLVDRPRKKKKTKHPGSSFNNRWQLDSNFQSDQKDDSKRRLNAHQLDSNGNNGLYIQPNIKKLKIRQSFDDFTPRSISSPVASQMSNMSNPKRFMELLVRDRNKKSKTLKMPAGQPGLGSPWSLFEDQLLAVLVHDMGPNWELISDAFNSNLLSKCIFRSSKECKERHKMLMQRSTSDDNAEDLDSSQPYPSTLTGIPEGSARQLFQQLQGPVEEKTLKSHFEKIIVIGRKQYNRWKQNDNQDPKQLQLPHSSYTISLSQVSPNNLNGGPVLTPLDLCDAITSTPDIPPIGNQGSHNGGPAVSDQGNGPAMLSGPTSSSFQPGSSNLACGNEFSSASVPLNPSIRDERYGIPKTGSLQKDDQQRMQQYNHMLSARNNSMSPGSHSKTGQPVRMLPTGNNIGAMSAINRGMPMGRPAFNGLASPSMLNPMQSRVGSGQGSPILKPRDSMHLMRPNHNNDHQRQIPPVSQSQTSQQAPQFTTNTSHPAFGMQFVKERQHLQQHALQHQQFPSSNTMTPRVQPPKSQLPISPPQNSTQTKNNSVLPPHGIMVNPHKIGNQIIPKQEYQKLVNLSQVKSAQKMVNNRLVNLNSSEPPASSAGAKSEPFWASG